MKHLQFELIIALVALLIFSTNEALAQSCKYELDQNKTTVSWIGYKLVTKAPVKGKFQKFTIDSVPATTVDKTLENATFELNGAKLDSGNKARDLKIAKFFFGNFLGGSKISGKVLKVLPDSIKVALTMNEVTKEVLMKKKVTGKDLILSGNIDMLDFALDKSYKAISKACSLKHKGKTWSEAGFQLVAKFNRNC